MRERLRGDMAARIEKKLTMEEAVQLARQRADRDNRPQYINHTATGGFNVVARVPTVLIRTVYPSKTV